MWHVLTFLVENDEEDAILEGQSRYLEQIEAAFNEGLTIGYENILQPVKFKLAEHTLRGKMTDHLCMPDIPGPVFSHTVKDLLDELGITNIEYFPLLIRDEFPEGPSNEPKREEDEEEEKRVVEYTDYYIANVVGLVDCVDHEKSDLEYFYPPEMRNPDPENPAPPQDEIEDPFADENPNDIDFITKLILDESKVDPALKIFRLKDQPDLLVFHDSIVEQIRTENLSGFVFVPVNQYTDVMADEEEEVAQ